MARERRCFFIMAFGFYLHSWPDIFQSIFGAAQIGS
jgi:hypothetical protein